MELETEIAGLTLRELTVDHAEEYYCLLAANRAHLTQHDDYQEEGSATLDLVRVSLSSSAHGKRFALWHGGQMAGRADLVAKDPGKFVLGYWLGRKFSGKGLMTYALRALMRHGKDRLGAEEYFAGVTHGNIKSIALLRRLGFDAVADFDTYTRFRRSA